MNPGSPERQCGETVCREHDDVEAATSRQCFEWCRDCWLVCAAVATVCGGHATSSHVPPTGLYLCSRTKIIAVLNLRVLVSAPMVLMDRRWGQTMPTTKEHRGNPPGGSGAETDGDTRFRSLEDAQKDDDGWCEGGARDDNKRGQGKGLRSRS